MKTLAANQSHDSFQIALGLRLLYIHRLFDYRNQGTKILRLFQPILLCLDFGLVILVTCCLAENVKQTKLPIYFLRNIRNTHTGKNLNGY